MKKIMTIFGTRPEAIKMCPLVLALKNEPSFKTVVCITGQHKQMLDQVLQIFSVTPDYDLAVMKPQQDLFDITVSILNGLKQILTQEKPDLVLVHGDTTTAYCAALAAFYAGIPVGHVEAGLRTYNLRSPFPEEFNRQCVDLLSSFDFAPTDGAKENLLRAGKNPDRIFVTGNTVIDALMITTGKARNHPVLDWAKGSRLVLLTAHRRENWGKPLADIFTAVRKVVEETEDIKLICPVHPNPNVQKTARSILEDHPRIRLMEPMDVLDFHHFLKHAHLILTDSGGIQEEASALGKPVLVLRDTTERPEGVASGNLRLIGTSEAQIYAGFRSLLSDPEEYRIMSQAQNPYGDGTACRQIVQILKERL